MYAIFVNKHKNYCVYKDRSGWLKPDNYWSESLVAFTAGDTLIVNAKATTINEMVEEMKSVKLLAIVPSITSLQQDYPELLI